MHYTNVASWLCSTTSNLRQSQLKTLSVLVFAAIHTVRLTLAELGRTMTRQRSVAAKHCIKREDRFLGNHRIEPVVAMEGWIRWIAMPRKQLLVSMDWVDTHCPNLALFIICIRCRPIREFY